MALLRNTNNFLLLLLLLLLLFMMLHRRQLQPHKHTDALKTTRGVLNPGRQEENESEVIPVVICASEERIGASMATINSVRSNTNSNVFFYIITLRDGTQLVKQYIEGTHLRTISYRILEFNPMVLKGKVKPSSSRPELLNPLNFVRFYLPLLDISHRRVIYLDDDVIVQDDIQELFHLELQPGHAAAFASDCDLPFSHEMVRSVGMQTTYMGFLDYRKQGVRDLGINPSDCSFNPGVFLADITMWKQQKVTKHLERWMKENFRENLYSSAMAGGVATPPMLIVFHDKFTTMDPLWHVRHLGWSPETHYPESTLQEAKLLHWNGRFKPWDYPCVHPERWEKWFVPDVTGRFKLVRPKNK
ncbi:glycosyltransferase 8 domain-containing protein 2 [Denticeps clupeoides]|uniref:Glycosyltransferase 8 domain-containing protein 2 n=1 Tax=Denticeps clupeoides TaxID=299321 RepID=A0AAY4DJC1_9TELE|nr:glycosyltransferase 8 domain-containing protein 2 [Denticeps clupeoides]XP_028810913.1 glycosyltransferase 8 domain-containing protein 2 [Denticeps clupeoides]